jgi:hypothetical protein
MICAGAFLRALAEANPPNPAPTITIFGRNILSSISFKPLLLQPSIASIVATCKLSKVDIRCTVGWCIASIRKRSSERQSSRHS